MLLNGKKTSICVRQDWESLIKIWPTIVRAQFSEKPSVVALLENAQDIIVNNFESFQIRFSFNESIMPIAERLLDDTCVHKPVWEKPTAEQILTSKEREKNLNENNER